MWPFPIFDVLLHKRSQNVQKLNNFKGVYVTRRVADQISWPFVKSDFDMLRILNLPMIASPYNVIFCWLESCLVRSLQAHSLRQQSVALSSRHRSSMLSFIIDNFKFLIYLSCIFLVENVASLKLSWNTGKWSDKSVKSRPVLHFSSVILLSWLV